MYHYSTLGYERKTTDTVGNSSVTTGDYTTTSASVTRNMVLKSATLKFRENLTFFTEKMIDIHTSNISKKED